MLRPSGPTWPPEDDTVENSLRRAYLRPPPLPGPATGDHLQDLMGQLAEAMRHSARQPRHWLTA